MAPITLKILLISILIIIQVCQPKKNLKMIELVKSLYERGILKTKRVADALTRVDRQQFVKLDPYKDAP